MKEAIGLLKGEFSNLKSESQKENLESHIKQYELYLDELDGFLFEKSLEKEDN